MSLGKILNHIDLSEGGLSVGKNIGKKVLIDHHCCEFKPNYSVFVSLGKILNHIDLSEGGLSVGKNIGKKVLIEHAFGQLQIILGKVK